MKIAYFVHDLTDPAVARRVRMLRAGGAEPVVLGFRRDATAPDRIEGAQAVDLGRTYDGRFGHRAAMTLRATAGAMRLRTHLQGAQVVMARTLEMLAVAEAARVCAGARARLVYECLDIHRLMLGDGAKSGAMRAIERALMRRADLLVVSSPAFLSQYFEARQGVGSTLPIETLLVENKVLELAPMAPPASRDLPPGPPWRVGWMGAIRCRKTLAILADIARRRPDLIDVRIHGRPAYTEFDDFDEQVSRLPNLTFHGPYTAADLPRLYGQVHFSWAIDFMEEGLNSSWLLPNRLYEASRHGAPPVALAGVQTGRYLSEAGFGLLLERPEDLEGALESMSAERHRALQAELDRVPVQRFIADAKDCLELVQILGGQRPAAGLLGASSEASETAAGKGLPRPEHYEGAAV